MILDIGCGEGPKKGDIGVDLRKTDSVDIIADARMLPFKDECFDHVYSSHLIEHLSHREVSHVLAEWVRVLKRNGIIEIRCPDLRARAFLFFSESLMAEYEEYLWRAGVRGELSHVRLLFWTFEASIGILWDQTCEEGSQGLQRYTFHSGLPPHQRRLNVKGHNHENPSSNTRFLCSVWRTSNGCAFNFKGACETT